MEKLAEKDKQIGLSVEKRSLAENFVRYVAGNAVEAYRVLCGAQEDVLAVARKERV